jgi:hypothetical protein
MAKTINEIRNSFYKAYSDNSALGKQEALTVAINATEQTLLEYYKTPEGRREIDESSHRSLSTEAAVEMLMEDVRSWAKTIREAR